jgi:hypothetical protein
MVLEIPASENHDVPKIVTKNVVLILVDEGDFIKIQSYCRTIPSQMWTMSYPISIHKDSDIVIKDQEFYVEHVVRHIDASQGEVTILLKLCLLFLNAMASPAVKVEKKYSQTTHKKHTPTPSDSRIQEDYHYIFMDIPKKVYENGTTKSSSSTTLPEERFRPYEHERQGHWRHFKNGTKTWINTQTINPGIGKKLEKKYVIRVTKQTNQSK